MIQTSTAYTGDGNYVSSQTDARGKTIAMDTDANKGTVSGVTDPRGQRVNYTYDSLKRNTGTQTSFDGKTYKNAYVYTQDKLTQVQHNTTSDSGMDVVYHFGYDSQNRPTTVSVGSHLLSTKLYNNTHGSIQYGVLTGIDYENGGKERYTYDDFKRIRGIRFDNKITDRYTYEYGANGQVGRVRDTIQNRTACQPWVRISSMMV